MRYLLDTNVCVDYLNGRYPKVIERLQGVLPGDVAVSVIAVADGSRGPDSFRQSGVLYS